MAAASGMVGRDQRRIQEFSTALAAPEDPPPVEMNDETARKMDVIWASIERAGENWRGQYPSRIPGLPSDRKELWGYFAADHEPADLPLAKEYILQDHGKGKVALDLGCGKSAAAEALLKRGWHVIGVDSSPKALDAFKAKFPREIASGQLELHLADICDFVPKEPADLVIAADILPYIDPRRFRETWKKIHDLCVKEDGVFIGNLFRSAPTSAELQMVNMMKEMGAWVLPDRRMVRPLLADAGYLVEKCTYRQDFPGTNQICIQFTARKLRK